MKTIIFCALFAACFAAKLDGGRQLLTPEEAAAIPVLRDERDGPIGAVYTYVLETGNDIRLQETGSEGTNGVSNKEGSFSFVSPEGIPVEISYRADEGGFQPVGEFIPVDHPKPPHALEQLRIAEEQRAAGIKFDERGFRLN